MTRRLTLVRGDASTVAAPAAPASPPSPVTVDRWQRVIVEANAEVPSGAHVSASWDMTDQDHDFALLTIGGGYGIRFEEEGIAGPEPSAVFRIERADVRVVRALAEVLLDLAERTEALHDATRAEFYGDRVQ